MKEEKKEKVDKEIIKCQQFYEQRADDTSRIQER